MCAVSKVDKRVDWRVVISLWIRHTAYEAFVRQDSFLFKVGWSFIDEWVE
ncbi:hypothetical protein [Bartonella gabonensis]|nr:hypothetical protein [Bartonella gabonensis]